MRSKHWYLALGLSVIAAWPAQGEVLKGVMAVRGAEMSWWGGVARDAIARQYDVEKNTVRLTPGPDAPKNYQSGLITFQAKQGKSIDLDKLHESIRATRLSGGTRMRVTSLEITARGEIVQRGDDLLLKVSGSKHEFLLQPEGKEAAARQLREAVRRGDKVVSVTGRVEGWDGFFPQVLRALEAESAKTTARKPIRLFVTAFESAK